MVAMKSNDRSGEYREFLAEIRKNDRKRPICRADGYEQANVQSFLGHGTNHLFLNMETYLIFAKRCHHD